MFECNEVKIEESEKAGSSWESNPGHLPPSQGQLTRSQLPLGVLCIPLPPFCIPPKKIKIKKFLKKFKKIKNIYIGISRWSYTQFHFTLVPLAHLLICSLAHHSVFSQWNCLESSRSMWQAYIVQTTCCW